VPEHKDCLDCGHRRHGGSCLGCTHHKMIFNIQGTQTARVSNLNTNKGTNIMNNQLVCGECIYAKDLGRSQGSLHYGIMNALKVVKEN